MNKQILTLLLAIGLWFSAGAQQQYVREIMAFKRQDSLLAPKPNGILFIGSSSFTNWRDVQDYFPDYNIINRGFGGSRIVDVIHYASDVIYPYKPRQVVIYAGENDLAYADTVSALQVLNRVKSLFYLIRGMHPAMPIVYISIKPSIARKNLMPRMEQANNLIEKFINSEKLAKFVNVYPRMLLKDGSPDPSIFGSDNLHMNAKGYALWQKALEPFLLKK